MPGFYVEKVSLVTSVVLIRAKKILEVGSGKRLFK